MSITGISFGGLASGLDTGAIIEALVSLERRPIVALQERKVTYSRKKSLYEDLNSKLETLQEKAKALRLEGELLDFKAETDNTGFVSVSTNGRATAGSYDIKVGQLAKAEVRTSNGYADKDTTTFGEGLLTFNVDGEDYQVTISATGGGNTLEGIANAINGNDDLPVNATVIDTGDASNPYKLVLTSELTGEDGSISITAAPANQELIDFAAELTDPGNLIVDAQNAEFEFNGVPVERSSNSINDLLSGVNITLIGEHSTDPASTKITVSTDSESTSEKIKEFVDAYNDLVDFAKAQNEVTQVDQDNEDGPSTKASPLLGDSALRTIQSSLRSIVGGQTESGNEAFSMLFQIGISSDLEGKLTFNQTEFDEALGEDPDALRNIFTNATDGLANQVYDRIEEWTDSVDGLLQGRIDGINTTTRDIDKQITRLEDRVERYEERITREYAVLEEMMNSLNSQQAALTSMR
jgi:flagellar hook-associated protein 2